MTKMDMTVKLLEESVLQAIDTLAGQSGDQTAKLLADLFKSSVLKKYKEAYDAELKQGRVRKEHLDKAIDFCFADTCVRFRNLPEISAEEKESEIKAAKRQLPEIKRMTTTFLINNGIAIIES